MIHDPLQSENSLSNVQSRLISVDDNICTTTSESFEFASSLLAGAEEIGLQPVLATNACFDGQTLINPRWPLARVFNTQQMAHWSLIGNGNSKVSRDLAGKPVGGTAVQNIWMQTTGKIARPNQRPGFMLRQWADDLSSLLMLCKPNLNDSLLLNTADDFAMLALASAMRRLSLPFPLRIDLVFRFVVDPQDRKNDDQLAQFGRQMNYCLDALKPHHVHLHATSAALADKMGESNLQQRVNFVCDPIQLQSASDRTHSQRSKKSHEMISALLKDSLRATKAA